MLVRRPSWFGRAAGGLVVVAVVLSAGAFASPGASEGLNREGGTFRVATGFVSTIDPALDSGVLGGAACGTLMGYPDRAVPEGLRMRAELAEAEPMVSRDGKTYTFTIRKDARFSDGKPVTARAFAHALERIFNPGMKSLLAPDFQHILGAQEMLEGKATTLSGARAKGRTLTLRLTRRVPDFLLWITGLCAVPPSLPVDPEGAKAPLPSAAPYYAAEYVPGERLVLKRNRVYRGNRVHHVDRFVAFLSADPNSAFDDIVSGKVDCCVDRASDIAARAAELVQRYGVNKPGGQFFIEPGLALRMFHLNTSRPLFRNNPKLRQAVNFAVDRGALTRELGARIGRPTDQYLLPGTPGFRDARIYPLRGPNLKRARALAKGHTRSGKVVIYAPNLPARVAGAQIVKENLEAMGLEVEIVSFPPSIHFAKLATPGEPFDIADVGWSVRTRDPSFLHFLFEGRTTSEPDGNFSYFNSPKYNRLLEEASRLTGAARYRAYGELDVQLSQDAAPAIPFAVVNAWAFVSARTGCVVMNPSLDLTAVCLK